MTGTIAPSLQFATGTVGRKSRGIRRVVVTGARIELAARALKVQPADRNHSETRAIYSVIQCSILVGVG